MPLLKKSLLCAACCALVLALPVTSSAQGTEHQAPPATAQAASAALPDSPGAAWLQAQNDSPQQPNEMAAPGPAPQQQNSTQQPAASTPQGEKSQAPEAQDQKPQRPVGTAAAESPTVNGITAAQPAGVAIAPAKQRRTRTIVIRTGAIIGAAAAIGAVVALTAGTSSKPPGAH